MILWACVDHKDYMRDNFSLSKVPAVGREMDLTDDESGSGLFEDSDAAVRVDPFLQSVYVYAIELISELIYMYLYAA